MRICLISWAYPPVGPRGVGDAKYMEKLATSLALRGCKVAVITSKTKYHDIDYSPQENLTIYPIITNWGIRGFRYDFPKMKRLLAKFQPNAINILYPASRIGSDYLLPYYLRMMCPRIPYVTTLFHFFPKNANIFYKMGAVLLYVSSTRIHFHDESLMALFRKIFPFLRRKTFFIPVGNLIEIGALPENIDKSRIRQELGLERTCRYISFVGYWYPGKGLDVLLHALSLLRNKGRQLKLLLVGGRSEADMNDYERGVLRLIDDLGLKDDVFVTGHRSDAQVVKYLLCSKMAVFPFKSNLVVMGRSSIMVPLSLGVPTIITRPAAQSMYLIDRKNVLMVPPNDSAELANTIDLLMSDESLRTTLSSNAKKMADRISWENTSRQWLNVYREIYA